MVMTMACSWVGRSPAWEVCEVGLPNRPLGLLLRLLDALLFGQGESTEAPWDVEDVTKVLGRTCHRLV